MKLDKVTRRRAIIVLALAVVLGLFIWSNNRSFALRSESTDLPPTPILNQNDLESNNNEIMTLSNQRVISKITDLAIGLPDKDKFVYVVQRLDGKYEQFVIPANYEGNVRELMGLKDDEKIVTGFALEPIRSTPIIENPFRFRSRAGLSTM